MDEHRKNERKKLLAFTPVYDSRQNAVLGYLGDLTTSGAMVIGEKPMQIGQLTSLAIDFPRTDELPATRLTVPARVAWCRHEESAEYYNTGFEFQEMSELNKIIVEAILQRYQFRREMPG